MKPGDVVRLKEGTLGLKGDDAYALYLDRAKRGKQYLAVLHTVRGEKEIDRKHVKDVVLKARVADPKAMEPSERTVRLKELVAELKRAGGDKPEMSERDLETLDDRRVWELTVNDLDTLTPEEAAAHLFDDPKKGELGAVRTALQACQTKGVGYFERTEGRGERYKPYPVDAIKAVRREIDGLRALRNKLIRIIEVPIEETGEVDQLLEGVPLDEAELDDEDGRRLALVGAHMESFVLHDEDRGDVGLADTPIHTLDGFQLSRFARFLAQDWVGPSSASLSGTYVKFLVGTKVLQVRQAMLLVARRHVNLSEHMSWDYGERAMREAERLPGEIPTEWWKDRRDLRKLETYTIDPPDAKDFDDAISIERDGEDTLLYVHIADVAQYVEKGTLIDHEAKQRGTSTYLPTGVLPMLPFRLADDLCSLREAEPRPAMTAVLRVAPDGEVKGAEMCESIIQVDKNLSYDVVNEALPEGREPFASLHALAQCMSAKRGGLALETDELKVHIDDDAVDPHLKSGSDATRMIEQFMVAANEAVARHLTEAGVPTPYRCHPLPDRSSVAVFNRRMAVLEKPFHIELPAPPADKAADAVGGDVDDEGPSVLDALKGGKLELMSGGFKRSQKPSEEEDGPATDELPAPSGAPIVKGLAQLDPEEREAWLEPFRDLLARLDEHADDPRVKQILQWKMLSCMGRALYTPENLGHFGLGSACYLHFTSPIRRYPDLVTHRQLKWLLRTGGEGDPPYSAQELAELCPLNTDQSIEAEKLERTLINVALAFESRTEKWAGTHSAVVNGLTKAGVFVSLPRGVEGRVFTSDIPGGPWNVDDAESMLFRGELDDPEIGASEAIEADWRELYNEDLGEMVHVRLRLCDKVHVTIADQDLADGRIKCRLRGDA